jgi:hypothetical protein
MGRVSSSKHRPAERSSLYSYSVGRTCVIASTSITLKAARSAIPDGPSVARRASLDAGKRAVDISV